MFISNINSHICSANKQYCDCCDTLVNVQPCDRAAMKYAPISSVIRSEKAHLLCACLIE